MQIGHALAGGAEYDGLPSSVQAQHVDDRGQAIVERDDVGQVLDVVVRAAIAPARARPARDGLPLVLGRQAQDGTGQGRREQCVRWRAEAASSRVSKSSRKPMSSISSASSSTATRTSPSTSAWRFSRSTNLPGVPTTMSAPW